MADSAPAPRTPNNLGALRLLLAALVILSHSSELVDGDRSREILTRVFGTLSFGELGVDGFFLISGYLITKSYQTSHSAGGFLLRRILRIYPGFVVSYVLCVFALGPFVGGPISHVSALRVVAEALSLHGPQVPGVFPETPYAVLNGSPSR
jgi:peptidoglycan/LPS O-acetylase OafA/YrhL